VTRGERAGRWTAYAAMALLGVWLLWRATHPHYAFETDDVNKAMGHWSLRLLWACLLLTPLSRILRQPALRRWRRPLGLGAFGFAVLHTVHFLLWGRLWPHRLGLMFQRPYMTIGLIALGLFVPLALTSNDWSVRRIAPRVWRRLHLLIYPAALLSLVHEVMSYARLKGEAGLDCVLIAAFLAAKAVRLYREPSRRPRLESPAFSATLRANERKRAS
jgi:sulfoxide reductase heme-binding subunit YedZ